MAESLLSPTSILLYGRVLHDLQIIHPQVPYPYHDPPPAAAPNVEVHSQALGANRFLRDQLESSNAQLARIYGFSYEGVYYDLPVPAIFLVHGPGAIAERQHAGATDRWGTRPDTTDRTGVGAEKHSFSEDIMVWSYDKGDFSIRMDVETGPLEQILLEAELAFEAAQAQQSGARVSGARARGARARGARAAGARVGGRGDSD